MGNLSNHPLPLARSFCKRNDDFDHAEAVLVETKLIQVGVNFLENEGLPFLVEAAALENFANDMGPVRIDRQRANVPLESIANEILFMVHRYVVKDRLNGVRALFVAAYRNEVALNELQDSHSLVHGAV